ncbi:hypothetical protein, partial [Thermus sp.]|uniref:hypothetical protein n=1 Tax=Thermus sp. TaxID=275 RepID=UPI002608D60A
SVDLETGEVRGPSTPPAPLPSAGVTGAQIRAIGEAVRELGLEAPAARELASRLVEREVGSVKELTAEEARELLDYLEDLRAALLDLPPEERGRRLSAWLGGHERGVPRGEALLEPLEGSEVFLEGET